MQHTLPSTATGGPRSDDRSLPDLSLPLAGGAVHGGLVELGQDVLAQGGHRFLARLNGHSRGEHPEAELVGARLFEALDGGRDLFRIADGDRPAFDALVD